MTGKQGFHRFRPKLVSLAVASCFVTSAVLANPTNPVVKHGAANFTNPAANVLHVTTATPQTIINWGSFSINANELTKFLQPSVSSAVLNRVVGGDPSAILGALQSNGRVLLVNPSGIIFGAGAQIDVAGLVATSLNLSNADFLANRMNFAEVPGAGSVVNNGNITTPQGGSVYLVGPAVTNNGIIASPKGEVVLAAGNSVELVNPGTPNLRVEISAAENEARNIGQIISESGRVGIYAGLINNSGTVRANSAVAQGGKILLQAKKNVTLESSSILDASGAGGGRIDVLAKNGGTANVAGKLDASAPNKGDGGFVETSADVVKIASGTTVNTSAAKGKAGTWLIDPINFWIFNDGGNIDGVTLGNNLNLGNVTIDTKDDKQAYAGTITVDDTVSWNSDKSLTLVANSDIFVNQSISNKGAGGINLYAGWDGTSPSSAPVVVAGGGGDIMVAAPISTLGDVKLIAGGHAHQISGYGGTISANGLRIDSLGTSANFELYANSVNTLSGHSKGGFQFKNNKTFSVGTVGGLSGITDDPSSGGATVNLGFSGTTGATNLNVNSNITAIAAGNANASINLNGNSAYGGNIVIDGAKLTATGAGGYGGSISVQAYNGGNVTVANSTLTANSTGTASACCPGSSTVYFYSNNVSVTGSTLQALGGANSGSTGQQGSVNIYGDSDITISSSTLRGRGGNGLDGGEGYVSASADSGTLDINGGSVIEALGGQGSSGRGGWASVYLSSNNESTVNITNSTVNAIAGTGPSGGGQAWVNIYDSNGNVNITNSSIKADGAEGSIFVQAGSIAKITNSILTVNGNKGSGEGGEAFLDVFGQNVMISGSTLSTKGGVDSSGYGGEASIVIESDQNLAVTNSTLSANAVTGANGGTGFVEIFANAGTVDTSGSAISGVGQTAAEGGYGSGVIIEAIGDIKLGALTSNDVVAVISSSGKIIDGNSGGNATAPQVVLFGYNGIGSIADPIETGATNLLLAAYGGEVGVANAGNVALSLVNSGTSANAVGTTGTMVFAAPISVSGSLSLLANNGMVVEPGMVISSGSDLLLDSGIGDMGFNGAQVTGNNVTLKGNNIFVGFDTSTAPTTVSASNLMKVTTLRNLNVLGGANPSANAELHGGLEVNLTVGELAGFVNVVGGAAGASAQISAGSPDTINLFFPTLSAGGFFVNGVEGAISSGNTGFFANGLPAVLGENFFVTYGGAELPPDVQLAINQTIASTNQQSQLGTDVGNETGGIGDPKEDKEKKQLPVCSR